MMNKSLLSVWTMSKETLAMMEVYWLNTAWACVIALQLFQEYKDIDEDCSWFGVWLIQQYENADYDEYE